MGKIQNYTRRQDLEDKNYPFVWQHDSMPRWVVVEKFASDLYEMHVVQGSRHAGNFTSVRKEIREGHVSTKDFGRGRVPDGMDHKEWARQETVEWLRNHPGGSAEIMFHVPSAEEFGIDYEFSAFGNIDWDWEEAFEEIGFERLPDNEMAPIASELGIAVDDLKENPEVLQEDNTYNYGGIFADDINFGTEEVFGGTLLSFKVHQGGDIRGAYGNSILMFSDDPDADYDLTRIVNPQIFFKIRSGEEVIAEGRLDAAGYIEWMDNDRNLSEDVVHDAREDYEGSPGHWEDVTLRD